MRISLSEAKRNLGRLIEQVATGKGDIVITKRGEPVACLVKPRKSDKKRRKLRKDVDMVKLLEGADTYEEIQQRLKRAGIDDPMLKFFGMGRDDPYLPIMMREIYKMPWRCGKWEPDE